MPAVGFDGPDFLNAAAIIDTDLDPFALNDWLHALEDAHGRDRARASQFSDRTLDIDIVYFDDLVLDGRRRTCGNCRGRSCAMRSCSSRWPTSRRSSSIRSAA